MIAAAIFTLAAVIAGGLVLHYSDKRAAEDAANIERTAAAWRDEACRTRALTGNATPAEMTAALERCDRQRHR